MTDITITLAELSFQVKYRSHLEAASISNAEARYAVEAGTEKAEAISSSLSAADASLRNLLRKYLTPSTSQDSDYTYHLDFSERRAVNKVPALEKAMEEYLINTAMAEFYRTVSNGELATAHVTAAQAYENEIVKTINYKSAPTWQD